MAIMKQLKNKKLSTIIFVFALSVSLNISSYELTKSELIEIDNRVSSMDYQQLIKRQDILTEEKKIA